MPKIDLTVTISAIVAIAAIISPVITALINNAYQLKLRKLEIQQQRYENDIMHRRKIFEDFLSSFNDACQSQSKEAISRYASSYSLVYICLPEKVRKDLGLVNLLIAKGDWDEAVKYVDAISMDIYRQMQKLKLQHL